MRVVPTYHAPEEVNRKAIDAEEMKLAGVTGGAQVQGLLEVAKREKV